MNDVCSLTPTICKLLEVPYPRQTTAQVNEEVVDRWRQQRRDSERPARGVIFCPDAIGRHVFDRFPELRSNVESIAPIAVELRATYPSVTPVCFASMFTGAGPETHGIRRYEKPVVQIESLFDVLGSAGKAVALIAVKDSSLDRIFRGRPIDHFTEPDDDAVLDRTLNLIEAGRHEIVVVYQQQYDDTLHEEGVFTANAVSAIHRHIEAFSLISDCMERHWNSCDRFIVFAPDHGAHDRADGVGTHGDDCMEDMRVVHFYGVRG